MSKLVKDGIALSSEMRYRDARWHLNIDLAMQDLYNCQAYQTYLNMFLFCRKDSDVARKEARCSVVLSLGLHGPAKFQCVSL